MKKVVLLSLAASAYLMASGYKIPENSTNAVALSAANVAHNHNSADAAFYNPAKMVFMSDENHIDTNLMYIGLNKVNYNGTYTDTTGVNISNENSEKENFLIPSLHYVSKELGNNARVGLSIVSPAGLSKRWKGTQGSKVSEEFTLQTIEINPTAAFKVNEKIGFAVGLRALYSKGVVKLTPSANALVPVSQNMRGDSLDFGYNLALEYKPTKELEIGLTYRSKIDMTIEGDADLEYRTLLNGNYAVSVSLPVPATFSAAIAYTLPSNTTFEFVYEKTYWSAYQQLDFNYANATAETIFGNPSAKNWKDTNAFRFGVTQELDKMTFMAGLVFDETPVPDAVINYELPDSDSTAISLGGRYKISKSMDVGLSALYSMRDSRRVNNAKLVGEFTGGNVLIVSTGLSYKF